MGLPKTDGDVFYAADVDEILSCHATTAQLSYQCLQANDVFTNRDNLGADEFTDSTGTNNTVDTTASTAVYWTGTDQYFLDSTGTAEETTFDNFNDGSLASFWTTSVGGNWHDTTFNEASYSGSCYGKAGGVDTTGGYEQLAQNSSTNMYGKTLVIKYDYNLTNTSGSGSAGVGIYYQFLYRDL